MIDIDNLVFRYGKNAPIFDDFSWKTETGDTWAIIGPSGGGKSTLLYLMAGLRMPNEGKIRIRRRQLTGPRRRTGLILQDYGLLPWATVFDNAKLGLDIQKFYGFFGAPADSDERLTRKEIDERAEHWLQRLGLITLRNKYPAQISGGQRQRTAIARTLAVGPDLLLMDEPFSALDAFTREDLQNLVLELCEEAQLTTVIVTHNIEEAVFLGQKILVLPTQPIRSATIIDNPHEGKPSFRHHETFLRRTQQVREALGLAI
jgi:ABC-type nitrate/sulfonate/bicarbonate transport system ATPase subunit